MASKKERLELGPSHYDDGLDPYEGDDFGLGSDKKDSRKPGSPLKKGVLQGLKSHMTDGNQIRGYVGKALPRQYGELFEDYDNAAERLRQTANDVRSQAQGPINQLAKNLKDKIPKKFKRTQKMLGKIQDATAPDDWNYAVNAEQQRTEEITSNVKGLFGEFEERMREDAEAREEAEADRFARDYAKSESQLALLNRTARATDHQMRFAQGVQMPFMKKSIELQYRMAAGIADLVTLQRGLMEQQRRQLDDVIKNTGLPEIQKTNLNENFKKNLRNKFTDKVIGGFTGGKGVLDGMMTNLQNNIRDTISMAMMGVDTANDAMSGGFEDDDETPEAAKRRRASQITSGIAGMAGPRLAGHYSRKAMRKMPKVTKAVFGGAKKIGYMRNNADSLLKDYAYGDPMAKDAMLRDLVAMMLPGKDKDTKVNMSRAEDLKSAAAFDNLTKRSITEVIPGFLSRILQELQVTRTGKKVERLDFNYNKGVFDTRSTTLSDLKQATDGGHQTKDSLNKVIEDVERAAGSLTEEQKNDLRRALGRGRKGGARMTERNLSRATFYKNQGATGNSVELAGIMQKYLNTNDMGHFVNKDKGVRARNRLFENLASSDSDNHNIREMIQRLFDQGQGEVAYAAGWVKPDGSIDFDRVADTMSGTSVGESTYTDVGMVEGRTKGGRIKPSMAPLMAPAAPSVAPVIASIPEPRTFSLSDNKSGLDRHILEALKEILSSTRGFNKDTNQRLEKILEKIQSGGGGYRGGYSGPGEFVGPVGPWGPEDSEGPSFMDTMREKAAVLGGKFKDRTSKASLKEMAGNIPGFWKRNLSEHAQSGMRFGRKMMSGALAVGATAAGAAGAGLNKAGEFLAESRIVGARHFQDFKDGLPKLGDVYIPNMKTAAITRNMFTNGTLRDGAGTVIRSLTELSKSVGDIVDESGAVVLGRADLLKSFVKVDGKILRNVWEERIKKGAAEASKWAGAGLRGLFDVSAIAKSGAVSFAKGLRAAIAPPVDVYVKGEPNPRLFAYVMKAGGYFNRTDGKVINYPAQIKGPVLDAEGNEVLTHEDFVKGLVNVKGEPIRTLAQKIVAHAKGNIEKARTMIGGIGKLAGAGLSTASRFATSFMSGGINGLKSGNWRLPKAGGGAGAGEVTAADQSVTILADIRALLFERLPQGGGGMGGGGGSMLSRAAGFFNSATGRNAGPDQGEQQLPPEANSGRMNTIDAGIGALSKGVGGLMRGGASLLSRFRKRGRKGGAVDALTGGGSDTSDPTAVGENKEEARQEEAQKEKRSESRMKKLLRKFSPSKKVTERADGKPIRANSAEDRAANAVNINASTKTLDDVVQAERHERKNTIDMITGAIAGSMGKIGDMLGDALGLGDGRGGKGRAGKVGKAAGKRGLLSRGAGMLGRAGGALGRGAMGVGRFLTSGVGGAGARLGGTASFLRGAAAVGSFAVKRLAVPALAGVATVLGAPVVATAIGVGGALWGLKSLYDLFSDKKPADADSKVLENVRLVEYGFAPSDKATIDKIMRLEKMLEEDVKEEAGQIQLDKDKIEVEPILSMFGVSADNAKQTKDFIEWFNGRFKPTYLKWMTVAKVAKTTLAKLDDADSTQRLKVLSATSEDTGWDVLTNPFGGARLAIGAKEVRGVREAAKSLLEKKKDKNAKDGVKETVSKGELYDSAMKANKDQMTQGSDAHKNWEKKTLSALPASEVSKSLSQFSADGLRRLPTGGISMLQSIRMRMYGYTEITMPVVYSMKNTEDVFVEYISVDSDNKAIFNGNLAELYQKTAKYFGLSPSSQEDEARWTAWANGRFLPVFTTYQGELQGRAGVKVEDDLERRVDAFVLYAMAQGIAAVKNVWPQFTMPNNQPSNKDPKSIQPFLDTLREQADKAKVKEMPTKTEQPKSDFQSSTTNNDSTKQPVTMQQMGAKAGAASVNVNYGFDSNPDGETKPANAGTTTPAVKSAPNPGSMPLASGEMANGSEGLKYVKAPSEGAINNLNPEMKKMFLAMAQEYGDMTQQKIQVNRGFVTYAEQAAEHAKNPRKAAAPGGSMHEFGLALDVNTVDLNRLEKLGLLRKYGFTRPIGGETWHMEPAGIQHDLFGLRKDPGAAAKAIAEGAGQGGGGVGMTATGFRFGGRDTAHAIKTRGASSATPTGTPSEGPSGGLQAQIAANRGVAPTSAPSSTTEPASRVTGGSPGGTAVASSGGGGSPAFAGTASGAAGGGSPLSAGSGNASTYANLQASGGREGMKTLVASAADIVGLDSKIALTTAALESSFNPAASSGTATGLHQFTKGTWQDMITKHGKEYGIPSGTGPEDPRANALLGARYLKNNLSKNGGGIEEAYLMHFLGPTGGRRAIAMKDDANMAQAFPSFVPNNKPTFLNPDGSPRTKAQFMEAIRARISKTAKDFGIPLPDMGAGAGTRPNANNPMAATVQAPAQSRVSPGGSGSPSVPGASAPGAAPRMRADENPYFVPHESIATKPAANQTQSEMIAAVKEGTTIAGEQLAVLNKILEATTGLVEVIKQGKQEAPVQTAPAPMGEPSSRAERSVRQVSAPGYRVA